MARNLDRVQVWTSGYFYINTNLATPIPTDYALFWKAGIAGTAPPTPWFELAHTDRENPLTITREGGEVTQIQTLQGGVIESTAAVTYFMDFTSLQLDTESATLFFSGGTATSSGSAVDFSVPKSETTQARQLLATFVDGNKRDVFYASTANIRANGSLSGPSPRVLPLRATVISRDADSYLFRAFNTLVNPVTGA